VLIKTKFSKETRHNILSWGVIFFGGKALPHLSFSFRHLVNVKYYNDNYITLWDKTQDRIW